MRARKALLWLAALSCGACQRSAPPPERAPADVSLSRDAGYDLELALLHERHGDPDAARAGFQQALLVAQTAPDKRAARLGLSRVLEAQGSLDEAISALEPALAGGEVSEVDRGPRASPLVAAPDAEGVLERLATLYARTGRFEDAERIVERGLAAAATDGERRDRLLRVRLTTWNLAGTADERIAERESVLTYGRPDEATLHLLAIAYGGAGPRVGLVAPSWALGGPEGAALAKLTRVYERLRELHPEDPDLRLALVSLYERGKRTDDAIALMRAKATGTPHDVRAVASAARCPADGLTPRAPSADLTTQAEIVRMLVRAGRMDEARTETARLVARGHDASGGTAAWVLGARLYLEQREPGLAARTLAAGAKERRRPEDARAFAVARAELLAETGKTAELRSLLAGWRVSQDPCLREEAERREPTPVRAPLETPARSAAAVP